MWPNQQQQLALAKSQRITNSPPQPLRRTRFTLQPLGLSKGTSLIIALCLTSEKDRRRKLKPDSDSGSDGPAEKFLRVVTENVSSSSDPLTPSDQLLLQQRMASDRTSSTGYTVRLELEYELQLLQLQRQRCLQTEAQLQSLQQEIMQQSRRTDNMSSPIFGREVSSSLSGLAGDAGTTTDSASLLRDLEVQRLLQSQGAAVSSRRAALQRSKYGKQVEKKQTMQSLTAVS